MKKGVSLLLVIILLLTSASVFTAENALSRGDANSDGSINLTDATILLQHTAGIDTGLSEKEIKNLDLNFDGNTDMTDALIMLQYVARLNDTYFDTGYLDEIYGGGAVATVSDTMNIHKLQGIGVEFDPHFYAPYNPNHTEEDWELIMSRIKKLGIQSFRVMAVPSYFEPVNDNDDPDTINWDNLTLDSPQMKSMKKILDAAQENDIRVNITFFCVDVGWLAPSGQSYWGQTPTNLAEFAENMSILMQYLINDMKYTCIKDFTPVNETMNFNPPFPFDYYKQACEEIDARFTKDGIRDKLNLVLGDDKKSTNWFESCAENLKDISDALNVHTYDYEGYTYRNISAYAKKIYSQADGLPVLVDEFGGTNIDAYHQATTDTYERGIFYSTIMSAFMNNGFAGMKHWQFFDQFYYDGPREDALMSIGLFKDVEEGWEVRPFYQAWGLIMKYTRLDSEVYPITVIEKSETNGKEFESHTVCGTAFKSPEGEWTYIITNSDEKKEKNIKIVNPANIDASLNVHIYSAETVFSEDGTVSDDIIPAQEDKAVNIEDTTYITLQPMTFAVVTEIED